METSPTTGHKQLQGFVNIAGLKWLTIKKRLPRAHVERARGTDADNNRYCSKDETVWGNPQHKGSATT